ncbi:FHA domain-containing protein [Bifidobacterium panos]|uniref:FHA domain-containing protein n=1 Tax=Bifidobacterium panos TaxID=2675321 RepID=A0ABX1SXM2_9BIFI|nr:FHA domain-containing protein [Bifidobacterium sp. DSM 109963]NMN01633.1 fHA domain-containing protein [Bifidobacterium sp. DSM 109963]
MNTLPFPPAPEPGWYADDFSATESAEDTEDTDAIESWDGTVLASSFTIRQPRTTYLLHNDATGQSITIDRSALLGRKPSETIPEGAKSITVEDPTHTISRNHAAISVDTDGQLWIEDYGSLNGTFIIRDGKESQVAGTPAKLDAPTMLRLGDQFLELTAQQN